jgi:PAS domain S-box-containing protein
MVVSGRRRPDAGILVSKSMPAAAVIIANVQLRIVHAEGVALDQRGYAVEDWPGRPLSEVLPTESLAELEPRYRAALAGAQQSFEYSSADAASTFAVQITPVRTEGGAILSVVAVMQDITEGLRVVEELSRSEARLRESERLVGVGSWELTPETGVITYSKGFAPDGTFGRRRFGPSGFSKAGRRRRLRHRRRGDRRVPANGIGGVRVPDSW